MLNRAWSGGAAGLVHSHQRGWISNLGQRRGKKTERPQKLSRFPSAPMAQFGMAPDRFSHACPRIQSNPFGQRGDTMNVATDDPPPAVTFTSDSVLSRVRQPSTNCP
jgi:hypothetical protein